MDTSYDVRIWKTEPYRGKKVTTYRTRWVVAGKRFGEPFATASLADSFRAQLVTAARRGEAFDTASGLPVSMTKADRDMNWLDFACQYVDMKWKGAAPTNRRSIAEGLMAVTVALTSHVRQVRPDPKVLRRSLRSSAFNSKQRDEPRPAAVDTALTWVRRNCGNVSSLAKPDQLRRAIDGLATNIDGKPASPNYFNRRRGVLHNALKYAVELNMFDVHPMADVADTWIEPKRARATVDKRSVLNPDQAAMLLHAVGEIRPSGPRLRAFFGAMYYAGLRPEEAVELCEANLDIPADGWGEIHLDHAAPDSGSAWTNTGQARERRQLKHRGVGDGRTVPCPPQLTALFQLHLEQFHTDQEGRLFRGIRNGGPPDSSTYERTWRRAREAVLTGAQIRSPLGKRPYDLRHAAVSTWLNAGVGAAQVAEWAGHSLKVLLEIYAHCIDGGVSAARRQIDAALGTASASNGR